MTLYLATFVTRADVEAQFDDSGEDATLDLMCDPAVSAFLDLGTALTWGDQALKDALAQDHEEGSPLMLAYYMKRDEQALDNTGRTITFTAPGEECYYAILTVWPVEPK